MGKGAAVKVQLLLVCLAASPYIIFHVFNCKFFSPFPPASSLGLSPQRSCLINKVLMKALIPWLGKGQYQEP